METLAAGMRARAQVVVDQIKATMSQVRAHLPSSPAKVGPLADIHRLKFGETIARSIRAEPMVRAMRIATAATLAAATPVSRRAHRRTPTVTAQSHLPATSTARSVQASRGTGTDHGASTSTGGVSLTYAPTINLSGDAKSAESTFRKMLETHKRDIKRMVDEEVRREGRRKH